MVDFATSRPVSPTSGQSFSPRSTGHPGKFDTEDSTLGARSSWTRSLSPSLLVVRRKNVFRQCFEVVVALSLLYIGSVFPFRLCFLEFHIPDTIAKEKGFIVVETLIDIIFMIDLVITFFFSFQDRHGNEVTDLRAIAVNYIQGFFFVNLLACIPPELIVLAWGGMDAGSTFNKSLRLGRLGQMSRLIKLTRILKLAASVSKSRIHQKVQGTRTVVFLNFAVWLFWVVHIMACGWYLCAALHRDPSRTWVARRVTSMDGEESLLDASPGEQWLHAMYFVLTVFTTVGFGDISAETSWEIMYASITMMVGAVVHSIAVSGMINIVMKKDQQTLARSHQVELVDGFARQTQLDKPIAQIFRRWAHNNTATRCVYDREQMCNLLTSSFVPRNILEQLPGAMFRGELKRNKFITNCFQGAAQVPPRFPTIIALKLNHRLHTCKEFVYHSFEQSWNLFLVADGTFANMGKPGRRGGSCPAVCIDDEEEDMQFQRDLSFQPISNMTLAPTLLNRIKTHYRGKEANTTPSASVKSQSYRGIYPYQFFGYGTYFGDSELFENVDRRSSVRCESSGGALLYLHKKDFLRLMEDFPSCTRIWMVSAKQREARRKVLLSRLTIGFKYKHFAAVIVQRYIRSRKQMKLSSILPKISLTALSPVTSSSGNAIASLPSCSGVAPVQSIRTQTTCFEARDAVSADSDLATVAVLRSDVDALRTEVRDGFKQLQSCLQAIAMTSSGPSSSSCTYV